MAFQPSKFSLPENPIVAVYDQCGGLGSVGISPRGGLGAFYRTPAQSLQGLSCGSCAPQGAGMGALEIDLNAIVMKMTEPGPFGVPWWMLGLGGFVLLMLLTGRGKESQRAYEKELSDLKRKYPRRGTRYGRAARAGYQAGWAIGSEM